MKHELHSRIGIELLCVEKELKRIKKSGFVLKLDKACGGPQYISLFLDSKDRRNAMCKVDAMLVYNNEIQIIIEIEESGLNPTKICGKYFASELSKFYKRGKEEFRFSENPVFIQILDTNKLENKPTSKNDQAEIIKKEIQEKCISGKIKQYDLFCISGPEDIPGIKEFTQCVKYILNKLP